MRWELGGAGPGLPARGRAAACHVVGPGHRLLRLSAQCWAQEGLAQEASPDESWFGAELPEPQGSLRPGLASWGRGRWERGGAQGCWGCQAFPPGFIQSMSAPPPTFFLRGEGGRVYVNLFFYIELPCKICFRQTASEIHVCRVQGNRDRASVGLQRAQVGRMGQPAVCLPIAPVWAALGLGAVT